MAKTEHIGPRALAWAREATRERGVRAYRLLQGVISLTRRHPKERVDWACGVALERRVFRYATLRRLVEQTADREPVHRPLHQQHPLIRDLNDYTLEVMR